MPENIMKQCQQFRTFNANGVFVGVAETATKAAELLTIDSFSWDCSGKTIQTTLSNVAGQFAWSDTRLPTASLVPLLKVEK
jgi:hypothetical protein